MLIGTEEEEGGWWSVMHFFCRSIRNTEQGINESCLMSTACFYNHLLMKWVFFLCNKRGGEGLVWVEVLVQRAASQEHPRKYAISWDARNRMGVVTTAFLGGGYVRNIQNIVSTSYHLPPGLAASRPLWFRHPTQNCTFVKFGLDNVRAILVGL